MEYLNNVTDKAKTIREDNLEYFSVFERPDIVYGVPLIYHGRSTGFKKYNVLTDKEIKSYTDDAIREYDNLSANSSGCFLRFKNSSGRVVIKCELRRKWDCLRMTLWNSSGFDVYEVRDNEFLHRTVFAPQSGRGNILRRILS